MKKYFRVIKTFPRKLPDHHFYGFEKESDFAAALVELHGKYAGHLGLCVTERDATCELRCGSRDSCCAAGRPRSRRPMTTGSARSTRNWTASCGPTERRKPLSLTDGGFPD